MYKILILLLLALVHSCNSTHESQNIEGIIISHAPAYRTTELAYQNFKLHTYTNDTIYRNCGYELIIEPFDSTSSFRLFTKEARLIEHANNRFKFIIEPLEPNLNLFIIINETDTVIQQFVAPKLPKPEVITETRLDSVYLSIKPRNSRLTDILPKDSRYEFEVKGERTTKLSLKESDIPTLQYSIIRSNYTNKVFQVLSNK